eukprot:11982612-Ditylum_brightwellii.AAC.1
MRVPKSKTAIVKKSLFVRVMKSKTARAEKRTTRMTSPKVSVQVYVRVMKNKTARTEKRTTRMTSPKVPVQKEDSNVTKVKNDKSKKGKECIISMFRDYGADKDNAVSTTLSIEKTETA